MDDAAFEELLQPWWRVFPPGALNTLHDRWVGSKKLRAFLLDLPPPCACMKKTWHRQCKAIELLMLASLVKPQAFMRLARKHCSSAYCVWSEIDETQVVPYRLAIEFKDEHLEPEYARLHLDALSLLMLSEVGVFDRTDVRDTHEALLSMACTPCVRERCQAMRIEVCVHLHLTSEENMTKVMEHLLELQAQRDRKPADYSFYLTSMELYFVDDSVPLASQDPISRKMLGQMQNLAAYGVKLDYIDFMPEKSNTTLDHRLRAGNLAMLITGAPSGVCEGSSFERGTRAMVVSTMGRNCFVAFCSGLMHSRGVEEVALSQMFPKDDPDADKITKWYWLVYALFHASASHTIRALKLWESAIPTRHIRYVERLFQAPQPLRLICRTKADPEGPTTRVSAGSFVTLARDAQIHFTPTPHKIPKHLSSSASSTPYLTIGSVRDKVLVLVPAYGCCWVNAGDIVSVRPNSFEGDPEKQWNLKAHGITKLEIDYSKNEYDAESSLQCLLKLIGEPVTSLTVTLPSSATMDEYALHQILTYCPNLKKLSIHGAAIPSLDVFVEAYESGVCRAKSLSLLPCLPLHRDGAFSFTNALGNPSTSIAQTLRHLRIHLMCLGYEDEDNSNELEGKDLMATLVSALRTNDRLTLLELNFFTATEAKYHADFAKFSSQYLNHDHLRLPLQVKLAFLSVIKRRQAFPAREALARLDTDVLSQIFSLAGTPKRRTITLNGRVPYVQDNTPHDIQ